MAAKPEAYSTDDYGSFVRDLAGTTALAIEGGDPEIVPALMKRTDDVDMRLNTTTTQEKAWMLRAAYDLTRTERAAQHSRQRQRATPRDGAIRLAPSLGALSAGITLVNRVTHPSGAPSGAGHADLAVAHGVERTHAQENRVDDERRAGRSCNLEAERSRDGRARRPDGE